jgi:invasion protein IalB
MAHSRWGALARLGAVPLASAFLAGAALAAVPESTPPLLLAQAADGTTSSSQSPPVSSAPDSFTARYGDWQLSCVRNAADPAAAVACRVVILVVAQGQQQPFAQIAFSRSPDGATHLTLLVPVNVLARTQPLVATDEADPGFEVPWLVCQPGGCAADLLVPDADLQRLRAYTGQGRILFTDSGGNAVTVSFSFRGLAQALDALAAELGK